MRVEVFFDRCARKAGGLNLGLTFHFPTNCLVVLDSVNGSTFEHVAGLSIGLIFWRLRFEFCYNRHIEQLVYG